MLRDRITETRQSVFAVAMIRAIPQQGEQKFQVLGSGFFISDDGYFITADHVINPDHGMPPGNARRPGDIIAIAQLQPDGRSVSVISPMDIIHSDQPRDFAILKPQAGIPRIEKVLSPDFSSRFEGEEVAICGYPLAASSHDPATGNISLEMPIRVAAGILSGQRIDAGVGLLEVDFPILPGNSGGPLISVQSGSVLGIAKATITVGAPSGPTGMFGICVDMRELRAELRRLNIV
jgi:serine protease Do